MAIVEERYAEALLEIGMSENKLERFLEETEVLIDIFESDDELLRLYTNPRITAEEKKNVTEKCFSDAFSSEIIGLMIQIIVNGREKLLKSIIRTFIGMAKEKLGTGVVYVSSAVSLSDDKKKALENKILETTEYRNLEMHYEVDDSLIGGMVIRIRDRILDNSIRTKLDGMVKELRQVQL